MRETTRPLRRTGGRLIRAALLLSLSALCGSGFAACTPSPQQVADGHDPLRALTSAAESRLYDLAYWARVERDGGPLWRKAVAFCGSHSENLYPNCANVRMAGWWGAPPPPPALPALPSLPLARALGAATARPSGLPPLQRGGGR
jgi:hypothetical protein